MRALVIERATDVEGAPEVDGARRLAVDDRPFETPAGECRIRVVYAGICGTDLELTRGYADYTGVPGHEFVGVVEHAPDGDRHWIGKRVVGEINAGCGRCEWCERGVREHCPHRSVLGIVGRDGAFATHLSLPPVNLHEVPDALSDEAAVFVEPTAAACEILTQVDVTPHAKVAVVGDSRLGLLVGQVLRSTGAGVTQIGRHAAKLDLARQLDLTPHPADTPLADKSFDITVDATGRPEGLARAMALVRPRGTVVMKSTFHGETPITLWPAVVDEVTLVGSRCGPFDRGLMMLSDGHVATDAMLAGTYSLDEYEAAFAHAGRALKVLLRP